MSLKIYCQALFIKREWANDRKRSRLWWSKAYDYSAQARAQVKLMSITVLGTSHFWCFVSPQMSDDRLSVFLDMTTTTTKPMPLNPWAHFKIFCSIERERESKENKRQCFCASYRIRGVNETLWNLCANQKRPKRKQRMFFLQFSFVRSFVRLYFSLINFSLPIFAWLFIKRKNVHINKSAVRISRFQFYV